MGIRLMTALLLILWRGIRQSVSLKSLESISSLTIVGCGCGCTSFHFESPTCTNYLRHFVHTIRNLLLTFVRCTSVQRYNSRASLLVGLQTRLMWSVIYRMDG